MSILPVTVFLFICGRPRHARSDRRRMIVAPARLSVVPPPRRQRAPRRQGLPLRHVRPPLPPGGRRTHCWVRPCRPAQSSGHACRTRLLRATPPLRLGGWRCVACFHCLHWRHDADVAPRPLPPPLLLPQPEGAGPAPRPPRHVAAAHARRSAGGGLIRRDAGVHRPRRCDGTGGAAADSSSCRRSRPPPTLNGRQRSSLLAHPPTAQDCKLPQHPRGTTPSLLQETHTQPSPRRRQVAPLAGQPPALTTQELRQVTTGSQRQE